MGGEKHKFFIVFSGRGKQSLNYGFSPVLEFTLLEKEEEKTREKIEPKVPEVEPVTVTPLRKKKLPPVVSKVKIEDKKKE